MIRRSIPIFLLAMLLLGINCASPANAGWGGHDFHGGPGFGGWGGGGDWHHHDGGWGGGFGGNVLGGIAGSIIGNAIGSAIAGPPVVIQQAPVIVAPPPVIVQQVPAVLQAGTPAWYVYCAQKYQSFSAQTGTFTGFDGFQHPCQ